MQDNSTYEHNEYGVVYDGNTGLIQVDGTTIFDSTIFDPRVWWTYKLFKWEDLPINTPGIAYPQDTDEDGIIIFEDVVRYDSRGTAYVILDVQFLIPELLGKSHYYLHSDKLDRDYDVFGRTHQVLETQYDIQINGSFSGSTITTNALLYDDAGREGGTCSQKVQLSAPSILPVNYLVATPMINSDVTTICNTTVYVTCTASVDTITTAYSEYSEIPNDRKLSVTWEKIAGSPNTSVTTSPSNSFLIQVILDADDQQDTVVRCYFNKGSPFETYSDTTVKRTPADKVIAPLAMTINKTNQNNAYHSSSKAGYISDVLVTQMQQQLAYFSSGSSCTTPRFSSSSDALILTWQNPQNTSTYTCTSRAVYTINSDNSLTKISDLTLGSQSYTIQTGKNIAIGCTFNYTDLLLRKRFKDRFQAQYFYSSDLDRTAFYVTDNYVLPVASTTSVHQIIPIINRTEIMINAYNDTPQISVLALSNKIFNPALTISRSAGSAYSVSEITPQVTPLSISLNKAYNSTITISRSKGISIGS